MGAKLCLPGPYKIGFTKTKPTDSNVVDYLNSVENEKKRADSFAILELMAKVTGEEPIMWGDSIIGFGTYRYRYASGR